ncbi:MAG: PAS domain S-box protein, partial [Nitrospirota bacterium]
GLAEIWVSMKTAPIFDSEGKITGGICIVEDITERKKMDEELKSKIEELEKFYGMAVGRELKMKELKEELARLKTELEKYKKEGKIAGEANQ